MKSISEAVESNWWRKKFGEVNVANGEKLDGGGAVNFLEEYKRKFPNSSAFNSASLQRRLPIVSSSPVTSSIMQKLGQREMVPVACFIEGIVTLVVSLINICIVGQEKLGDLNMSPS